MTQTMREQLQALVQRFRGRLLSAEIADVRCIFDKFDLQELESILATPDPAVTVRAGWVCKDESGVYWHAQEPTWDAVICRWQEECGCDYQYAWCAITDPWPDHPNGGPECVMEVG